ncbi:MAG: hypothetical protein JWM21_14 [Acidobacteria bacterium]|nr:hypothetical protein [Acidobacteriota bacterium]
MSQPDPEQADGPPPSVPEGTDPEANGLPKTPYRIAAFILTVVIATYSWIFKMWDGSEFPETFAHPAYWLFLGLIFLVAGVWAFFVGNRRSWFDFVIVEMMFLAAAGLLIASVSVDRQARPSASTFTVVLFTLTDHTGKKDVGNSFRDNIQRELEARYRNEILVLPRDREIKGEKPEEQVLEARAWSGRKSGCHLAVWGELSTHKDGQSYVVHLHYVRVFPFGTQSNHDELIPFDEVDHSLTAKPLGSGGVGEDAINEVTNQISVSYGLATYDKADYEAARRILSTPRTVLSEYFAGRAAYELAEQSTNARQLYEEAEGHFLKAITLDGDANEFNGSSFRQLGKIHDSIFTYLITDQPRKESDSAIIAYSKAAEIFKETGDLSRYADSLIGQARATFNLSSIEQSRVATNKELKDAEALLHEALKYIGGIPAMYSDAQNILGFIYIRRQDYLKAIQAYETALGAFKPENTVDRLNTLGYLGGAQIEEGRLTGDEALFDEGMGNLRLASQTCQAGTFSVRCHNVHKLGGKASFRWAQRSRTGSPKWTREIDRAIAEFELSNGFVSKTGYAQLYAESKEQTALANIERASTERGDERRRLLKAALTALTDGIDALTVAGFDARHLYEKRAQCYDRLRLDSMDPAMKNEYLRLADQDIESTKRPISKTIDVPG